jgi:acyl dehydratase
VFHGDTIYAESTVIAKEDGVVTVESKGMNQRGEAVVSLRRRIAVPCQTKEPEIG